MDVREEELQHTNWLSVSQERQERERKGIIEQATPSCQLKCHSQEWKGKTEC